MPDQLSSYIAVNADGTVSAFFGKMDMGQGLFVAIGQMVAEELDVPFKAVTVIMGDTATSVNQGGASGSTGIQLGGKQMRMAAAEARRVLVEMARAKLGLPAEQLTVTDGVVHAKSDASKKASYAELIGGRYFNVQLDWNKQMGNTLYAPARRKPKDPKDYKIVGQPIHREDIAPKVYAQEDFCTDVKVPGMVHGRMIRPPVAGAVPVKVDEARSRTFPAPRWSGTRASSASSPTRNGTRSRPRRSSRSSGRTQAAVPGPGRALRPHPQGAGAQARGRQQAERQCRRGVQDRGAGDRGRVRMAVPVASLHGPACALVEIKDGKCHLLDRDAEVALRAERASPRQSRLSRARTSTYLGGRAPAPTAAATPTTRHGRRVLAKAVGKPVRLQYTREQGNRLGPEGPASIHRARAADAPGQRHRLRVHSKGSRASTSTPSATTRRHARRPHPRHGAQVWRRLRRAGGILRVRQQAHWRGRRSRRCSTAPRRCAARICAIRSDRRSTSPANRSWTRWRQRSASIRSSSACATSRTRATSR
jgi:hypothetical protein